MADQRHWTPHQIKLLRELYPDFTADSVALAVGRTVRSVRNKVKQLDLSKSNEFYERMGRNNIERAKLNPAIQANQFKPGLVPWNKGKTHPAHPNSKATQFKPGRKPHEARNYVPIGSLRLTREGHVEPKVSDDTSVYSAKRWVALHRLRWQEHHGDIPAGHVVRFKAGQITQAPDDITIDRLECISRAENARRNAPWSYSPELHQIYQLKGVITRQVKRIVRESQQPT